MINIQEPIPANKLEVAKYITDMIKKSILFVIGKSFTN